MARIRALVAHILGRTCRDADCGPCSFDRTFYAPEDPR